MKKLWLVSLLLLASTSLHAAEPAAKTAGLALHGDPKYINDAFTHFDYANPDAPKGGEVRLAAIGTFDNLNPYILNGMAAAGATLLFETLMEPSLDEPFSQYGWVAESVTVAPDRSWVSYLIRPEARFHDGQSITAEDVIFSFETLSKKGHPFYRSYYKDVIKAEKFGGRGVKFTFAVAGNTELPLIMGQLPILARHYWYSKDFAQTTLTPLVGSGPYQIESVVPGRTITYKRVKDWWAQNLPINKGRYNFDTLRYDYFRDQTVMFEAFLSGQYDFRLENVAKNWAMGYTTPAVKNGLIIKQEIKNELPNGMQGFIFNTRRDIFKDKRVREALALAFDFEWSNRNFAFGSYKRLDSYFANSELAAHGLPSSDELKLLEPLRGKIPDAVFTTEYKNPVTDGSGEMRDQLAKARDLLREAGWLPMNGKLVNSKKQTLKFEIVDSSPLFERWVQPYIKNLQRLGVEASFRVVDTAQYQNLMDNLDFDMTVHIFGQSLSPGNEQRDFWGSARADQKGSRNLIGIKDPAIDALVDAIIRATDRASLVTACRALDRVLLWNHYVVPHWYGGSWRIAYWDMFGMPRISPLYGLGFPETWWIDAEKAKRITASQKRNR